MSVGMSVGKTKCIVVLWNVYSKSIKRFGNSCIYRYVRFTVLNSQLALVKPPYSVGVTKTHSRWVGPGDPAV